MLKRAKVLVWINLGVGWVIDDGGITMRGGVWKGRREWYRGGGVILVRIRIPACGGMTWWVEVVVSL